MCCCYRDTKMEIQGLADAQNTHYQHGVPRRTGLSPPRSTRGACSSAISNENEVGTVSESRKTHSDNNNNRPRTSPFRLLAENGSGVCLPVLNKPNGKNIHMQLQPQSHEGISGHHNVTAVKDKDFGGLQTASDQVRGVSKYDVEKEDRSLQMALPLFDGEDGYSEHSQQCQQLTLNKSLRQQHLDGATLQQSLVSENTVTPRSNNTGVAKAQTEEFYVDFNVVQEGNVNTTQRDQPTSCLTKDGERVNGKAVESSEIKTFRSMEVHSTPLLLEPDDELNNVISRTLNSQPAPLSDVSFIGASERLSDSTLTDRTRRGTCIDAENGNIVLSNEYGDTVRHAHLSREIISENDLTSSAELGSNKLSPQSETKSTSASNEDMMDSVEMPDASNNSEFMSDFTGLSEAPANVDNRASSGIAPAMSHETFSGTIMINNQSIIVTIENGVLTLAASPEGYTYKDDGMVSLKEHLGMKDHEDIVLLNYDSGTKSIGKISNVAVSAQQDEPKAGLSVSDTELNLADDSSLTEIGATLDSCTPIKQEDVRLCGMDEGHPGAEEQPPKSASTATGEDELQPMSLAGVVGLSKKAALVTYCCPQPGCTSSFETRQKLKLHLLFHTEDQRPFKCTVEGCGWSFTTSYKLKRHLQSHDKLRPYRCEWENCGRRFTTVYNLKAHAKAHDSENAFACEVCSERFRSATRLANHQRTHFEPERPFKCEFPGCEKTFITFSALFSHNRTHFRETGLYSCTFPGCDKRYDKACRLKIHLRSHTGERPFVCDSEACGWTFTSMSKLLRHKRKHDDDRRFTCPEDGCGKSFTRAEHLKGHSITHLGTKPFECQVEGCNAKFSARSSLYIHSKKHRQDGTCLRSRCPMAGCTKHFSSRSSLKSHMVKHHNLSADVLNQLETTSTTLTPSSELTSGPQNTGPGAGSSGTELANLDLTSLFSSVPASTIAGPVPSVGGPGAAAATAFTMDISLVSSGILTIDPGSVGSTLGPKTVDPLILAASADMGSHVLDTGPPGVLPQGTLNLDDVQTVSPEALGSLTTLTIQGPGGAEQLQVLSSSSTLASEPPSSSLTSTLSSSLTPALSVSAALASTAVPDLLSPPPSKAEAGVRCRASGPLLGGGVEALGQTDSKGMAQFVFPAHSATYGSHKEAELGTVTPCTFLESGGSARTDYRAIQLAKKKKQKTPAGSAGAGQRKAKGGKSASSAAPLASSGARFGEGADSASGGLTLRDPVTGAQYVQIQLLQDDPGSDGDLAFQLSSQTSSSHSQLTVDLPVNILQEPSTMTEEDNGSDNSQFTGSTINLQDLE
ncbi:LOW QUALITY PROTEIN: zinc finger protein ZXDC [Alosa sapidissima]|uniref:LOW QUALITY PROTEIN: zinc finger protein ZXDC n=1 Tax=Alosa sapidissima TaxID=34773 RepID=UPI001C088D3D|nr:LOW QUALITY PROTEIN: zinc finger protein ZXDC [Alosa sapidissima]